MPERGRRSWPFLLVLFAALFAGQVALYYESFWVKPAGDDFAPPLAEIARGTELGPWALFEKSAQPHNYRPIQSYLMYVFGTISPGHELQWVRVLHLACMGVYAAVGMLWFRIVPGGRLSAIAGATILFAHPVLAGPVGGIDGFSGSLATAIMWLGAWIAIVLRDRLAITVPLLVICLLVGATTKEYSLGIGPLAVWSVLMFWNKSRWRRAIIIGLSLAIALAGLMIVRKYTIPPGLEAGLGYVTISAIVWAKNIALFALAILFLGSTPWVFASGDPMAYVGVGIIVATFACFLGMGLFWHWRWPQPDDAEASEKSDVEASNVRRWIVYLLVALPLAGSVPVLTPRVSEMYAVGLVLPFALIVSLACDGWFNRQAGLRAIGVVFMVAAAACAAVSAHAKVHMLRHVGEQADSKLRAILETLPAEAHDQKVLVLMYASDVMPQPRYSIFVMDDWSQISQPWALHWVAPHRSLTLENFVVDNAVGLNTSEYEHVLIWRADQQRFQPRK